MRFHLNDATKTFSCVWVHWLTFIHFYWLIVLLHEPLCKAFDAEERHFRNDPCVKFVVSINVSVHIMVRLPRINLHAGWCKFFSSSLYCAICCPWTNFTQVALTLKQSRSKRQESTKRELKICIWWRVICVSFPQHNRHNEQRFINNLYILIKKERENKKDVDL